MLHGKSKSEMINRRIEMNIFDRSTDNGDASNDNDKDFVFYDDLVGNGGDQVPRTRGKETKFVLFSNIKSGWPVGSSKKSTKGQKLYFSSKRIFVTKLNCTNIWIYVLKNKPKVAQIAMNRPIWSQCLWIKFSFLFQKHNYWSDIFIILSWFSSIYIQHNWPWN